MRWSYECRWVLIQSEFREGLSQVTLRGSEGNFGAKEGTGSRAALITSLHDPVPWNYCALITVSMEGKMRNPGSINGQERNRRGSEFQPEKSTTWKEQT